MPPGVCCPGNTLEADLSTDAADDGQAFAASILGKGFAPEDLSALINHGYLRLSVHPTGTVLAHRAEPQRDFSVVLSGRIQVVRTRSDGSRHIIDVVGPGGACGAVTAFAPTPRWPADVHAASAVRLAAVDVRQLMAADDPEPMRQRLLQNCVTLLADRARHLNMRGEMLTRRSLRARLAFFLLRNADSDNVVSPELTRQELADHLQVSRASMTRELGRMADEGLVVIRGRVFELPDRDALSTLAR